MPDKSHLYRDLPGFTNFAEQALDDRYYAQLPEDWLFIVTDVVSSTQAVEHGRYKDVNYIGAACIAALKNALPHQVIPTVFSGDGASAAVPASDLNAVVSTLKAIRHWASRVFALDLRVGIVPVSELIARGARLEVSKLDLGFGNEVAMFRGTGVELADRLIKDPAKDNPFLVSGSTESIPDLHSLSCRWSPLKPAHDVMLCALIEAHRIDNTSDNDSYTVYRKVLRKINQIVMIDSQSANPVKRKNLKFWLNWRSFINEIRSSDRPWIQRVLSIAFTHIAAALSFTFKLNIGAFDPVRYQQRVAVNSDYKRINGALQLVLDCTNEQADAIEVMLEKQFNDRKINYGVYRAESAVVTCITPDVINGVHIHYVDGTDCGFWQAATELKARRLARAEKSPLNR